MINQFEENLKKAYSEYLNLELATIVNFNENEIYQEGWYVLEGLSIVAPHPHRYYTLLEFVYWVGKSEKLYNRFLKN